jgi:gluconokinase
MIIVLMGVTGSGKTTVGRLLAEDLGWTYVDADDFHSELNIEKMRGGIPLSDADRKPWLESLRESVLDCLFRSENAVFACSALKESYREFLLLDERVKLVYLKGNSQVIRERLAQRRGHYMDPTLLDSQLETLEEPAECLRIDASSEPRAIISTIRNGLSI